MDSQNKDNVTKNKPWFKSNASDIDKKDDEFRTFQSKDPIISIHPDRKSSKEKAAAGEAHGGHIINVEHPTSYAETLMHILKGNLGSGIFAMGDAIKNAGLVVGPCLAVVLGLICIHCMHMLLTASRRMLKTTNITHLPGFADTVELCFSTGPKRFQKCSVPMKRVVNTLLCITQAGFCCVYFVLISTNIKQVMDNYGIVLDVHAHMAVILLPILLCSLIRSLKFLAPLSTLANVFMCVGIVITLYFTVQELPSLSERRFVGTLAQFPLFFGTALYAFEGIGLILPLQKEMKKPEQFQKPLGVLNVGMGVVMILFLIVGTLGYLKYGEDVMGSITLNLPEDSVLAQIGKATISAGILLTYPLQIYIVVDIMWPSISSKFGPFKFPILAESVFRSSVVLVTFTLAEAIPYLNLFISLVGAVGSTALALLIPPLLEMVTKSAESDLHTLTIIKNVTILIIGIIGMATGTYESVKSIVEAFSTTS